MSLSCQTHVLRISHVSVSRVYVGVAVSVQHSSTVYYVIVKNIDYKGQLRILKRHIQVVISDPGELVLSLSL